MDRSEKIKLLRSALAGMTARLAELELSQNSNRILSNLSDSGDTAWMLSATSLVLMMTLPGLTLYYAGMVRIRNVLTSVMQVFCINCVVTVLWLFCGYSLAFSPTHLSPNDNYPIYGNDNRIWLRGMTINSAHSLAPTIPEPLFCSYQLTFAILTVSLICGSVADRMNFVALLIFSCFWLICVYCVLCHVTWHPDGFLYKAGNLDFAGGGVIHLSSGVAGLVFAYMLGPRRGFGMDRFDPHNILFSFIGACMLWVGWFGFNAGSAFAANDRAAMAQLSSQIAASSSALSWLAIEWKLRGTPSVLGSISGAFAGLVCVTPASGYINPTGAFFIGLYGGPLCYLGCQIKHYIGVDDALDVFGIHAIGGIVGSISTAFFSTSRIGGEDGVYYDGGGHQLGIQLYAICVTAGWSAFATFVILKLLDMGVGLRVSEEVEYTGLDISIHGETIEQKKSKRTKPNFKFSDLVLPPKEEEKPGDLQLVAGEGRHE